MENNNKSVTVSLPLDVIGFITFIVFLILKVTNAWPDISWFWVFFPLWFPLALGAVFCLIVLIIYTILNR